MGWTEIYITGTGEFHDEVRRKLESSTLKVMAGSLGGTTNGPNTHDLYWLEKGTPLRRFKQVLGSRLIWKYRLRFYTGLEEFIASQHQKTKPSEFTEEEMTLMSKIQETLAR